MTDKDLTHLVLITDRSGSMHSCREDMQGGINALLAEQAQQPGRCLVTHVQFDQDFEVLYTDRPVADVPAYQLSPRGSTALLDALGRTINMVGAKLSALPEAQRPGAVIVAVTTDGYENASREYQREQVHEMIKTQTERYQWLFLYLGANQDAIAVGTSLGFARGQTMTFDTANAAQTYAVLSANTSQYRANTAAGMDAHTNSTATQFTDEQREQVAPKDPSSKPTTKPTTRKATSR